MMNASSFEQFVGEVTSGKEKIGDVENFDENVFAHDIVPHPNPVIVAREN